MEADILNSRFGSHDKSHDIRQKLWRGKHLCTSLKRWKMAVSNGMQQAMVYFYHFSDPNASNFTTFEWNISAKKILRIITYVYSENLKYDALISSRQPSIFFWVVDWNCDPRKMLHKVMSPRHFRCIIKNHLFNFYFLCWMLCKQRFVLNTNLARYNFYFIKLYQLHAVYMQIKYLLSYLFEWMRKKATTHKKRRLNWDFDWQTIGHDHYKLVDIYWSTIILQIMLYT